MDPCLGAPRPVSLWQFEHAYTVEPVNRRMQLDKFTILTQCSMVYRFAINQNCLSLEQTVLAV
jgi:hypothetical protein